MWKTQNTQTLGSSTARGNSNAHCGHVGSWGVDLPTQPGNRLRFVRACVRARAERHPLYASIRPGMSCFAARGRGRGCGLGVGVAVGTAVDTALGAVVGVTMGVGTGAGATLGHPNLPIPLAGRYG
jgi:hypothetical protein